MLLALDQILHLVYFEHKYVRGGNSLSILSALHNVVLSFIRIRTNSMRALIATNDDIGMVFLIGSSRSLTRSGLFVGSVALSYCYHAHPWYSTEEFETKIEYGDF